MPLAAKQKQGKTMKYILGKRRDFKGDVLPVLKNVSWLWGSWTGATCRLL